MERLWERGLHLVTSIRRTMKNHLLPLLDKMLLRKRFIIILNSMPGIPTTS
ncbi:MAG: hypothetical protein OXG70_00700 [Cyanobacteria bacterium MAG IRC1_bin_28]|nr:hypothetical protein [Cyanobacteria bacterium MAG IRC3_bin_20]MCY3653549.1 hypothetical protein [Cyanobacteria bacterium MAG IRC1_bin_28]MDE0646986.1 hypothetical protein [Cyanobacteria bacterium MAG IRC4_bin_6]